MSPAGSPQSSAPNDHDSPLPVSLAKGVRYIVPPVALTGRAVLTIDVEDYYHVAAFDSVVRRADWAWYPSRVQSNVARLLDLCDEYGIKATWFVLGWEAEKRPSMVRLIAERGHEVACHSHLHREVFSLAPASFQRDTSTAVRAIEDACGVRPTGYRAPSFSITKRSLWALDVLAELGFRYDSSVFPVHHPAYGIPKAPFGPHILRTTSGPLWELPPATAPAFGRRWAVAGGGWLRQMPLSILKAGLKRHTRAERLPAVLYLHPWEIDPEQPRLHATLLARIRHYRNLDRMEPRLRQLLGDYRFTTCSGLIDDLEGDAEITRLTQPDQPPPQSSPDEHQQRLPQDAHKAFSGCHEPVNQ